MCQEPFNALQGSCFYVFNPIPNKKPSRGDYISTYAFVAAMDGVLKTSAKGE